MHAKESHAHFSERVARDIKGMQKWSGLAAQPFAPDAAEDYASANDIGRTNSNRAKSRTYNCGDQYSPT